MFFVSSGVGPYSGQSVHFRVYAPEKIPYAINRYAYEAQRHFGIINERLAKNKYMLGDTYTVVDMNIWGWSRLIPNVLGEKGWEQFPNLKRLTDEINARPAAAQGDRAEGQAQVQDRDGRRGEERDVQASHREGGVASPVIQRHRQPLRLRHQRGGERRHRLAFRNDEPDLVHRLRLDDRDRADRLGEAQRLGEL